MPSRPQDQDANDDDAAQQRTHGRLPAPTSPVTDSLEVQQTLASKRAQNRKRVPRSTAAAAREVAETVVFAGPAELSSTAFDAGESARYELRHTLGTGGMGVVRAAFDPRIRREVAYKVMRTAGAGKQAQARFLQEAQVTGQLEHPNIVPVHDLGKTDDGRLYFTMKVVHGESLKQRLATLRTALEQGEPEALRGFPLPERLAVLRKVGEAMSFAHAHGVIHRDLKPENIMLGRFGEVLVMDWGLARLLEPTSESAANDLEATPPQAVQTDRQEDESLRTLEGTVSGTPAYMSPEQAAGKLERLDARTDVFALGAILYEMLTLTPPYRGKQVHEVLLAASKAEVEPAEARASATWGKRLARPPAGLCAIAHKAMSAHPRRRYASVAEMMADLAAWQAHEPIQARRDSLPQRAVKLVRRHPVASLVASLTLIAGLVVATLVSQLHATQRSAELAAARSDAAELENERLHMEREQDKARSLAQQGQIAELQRHLGVEVRTERDAVVEEFEARLHEAIREGRATLLSFAETLHPAEVERYLEAFERLFDAAEVGALDLTGSDYFHRGYLRKQALHDWPAAIADFTRALDVAEEQADATLASDAYTWRALCKALSGDEEGALADYRHALEHRPQNTTARYNRAVQLLNAGREQDARADLDALLDVAPESARALFARAQVRLRMNDTQGALEDYNAAISADPQEAEPYLNRGNLHAGRGAYRAAFTDYDRYVSLRPDDWMGWLNRGQMRLMLNERNVALADIRHGWRLCQQPQERQRIEQLLRELGEEPPPY